MLDAGARAAHAESKQYVMGRPWFGHELAMGWSWAGHGSVIMGVSWLGHGSVMGWSWAKHGQGMGWSWVVPGLVMAWSFPRITMDLSEKLPRRPRGPPARPPWSEKMPAPARPRRPSPPSALAAGLPSTVFPRATYWLPPAKYPPRQSRLTASRAAGLPITAFPSASTHALQLQTPGKSR